MKSENNLWTSNNIYESFGSLHIWSTSPLNNIRYDIRISSFYHSLKNMFLLCERNFYHFFNVLLMLLILHFKSYLKYPPSCCTAVWIWKNVKYVTAHSSWAQQLKITGHPSRVPLLPNLDWLFLLKKVLKIAQFSFIFLYFNGTPYILCAYWIFEFLFHFFFQNLETRMYHVAEINDSNLSNLKI